MALVWVTEVTSWHWLVLGVACIILDIFSPGVFFLWIGIAAGLVGLVLLVVPDLSWEWQVLLFALLSLVSTWTGWRFLRRYPSTTEPTAPQSARCRPLPGPGVPWTRPSSMASARSGLTTRSGKLKAPNCEHSGCGSLGVDGTLLVGDAEAA